MTAAAFFAAVGLAFAHAAGLLDLSDVDSVTAAAFFAAVGLAFAHAAGLLDLSDVDSAALGVTIAAFGIWLIWPLAAETWREVPE